MLTPPPLGDDVGGLRLVDVDRLDQVVAVRADVADVDRAAAVQLALDSRRSTAACAAS